MMASFYKKNIMGWGGDGTPSVYNGLIPADHQHALGNLVIYCPALPLAFVALNILVNHS